MKYLVGSVCDKIALNMKAHNLSKTHFLKLINDLSKILILCGFCNEYVIKKNFAWLFKKSYNHV